MSADAVENPHVTCRFIFDINKKLYTRIGTATKGACVHACVCVTIEMFLQYSIHSEEQGPAGKKGLLVLQTIFSYPTRTGEELLHKNTSIRERAGQRGQRARRRRRRRGKTGKETGSLNGRERVNSLFLSLTFLLSPSLSVCLSVWFSLTLLLTLSWSGLFK